jgi:AraC family transcriptional regulator of adaptative response / DNA-3-methyladenine glycosylase II
MIHVDPAGPFDWPAMLAYFRSRAIRGVEHVGDDRYRRTTREGGVVELGFDGRRVTTRAAARERGAVERLLGLGADHAAALAALHRAPVVGARVRSRPGLRVPGTWDPFETGVRAIIGQQVSVAGAGTVTARVVARHGSPVPEGGDGLVASFPSPSVLAAADLDGLGLTGARITAVRGWSTAVAAGEVALDRSVALEEFVDSVVAIRGLGPWTAHYLALRLGYTDAFPVADLGLQRAAGLDQRALAVAAERWRPHRALAAVHLWETPPPARAGRVRAP